MARRLWILWALTVIGCAEKVRDEFVPPDQVPLVATSAAESVYPGFRSEQVWKFEQDGETVYEFRGKTPDGKSHEATVSAAGKVLWPVKK